jgi:hypothetical protein
MSKTTKFSGNPIIGQLLKFLDKSEISRTAKKHKADHYYKKFRTMEHLITMIFAIISSCSSLRELTSIILACEGKINHLGIDFFPRRSTISDANMKRPSKVFEDIYYGVLNKYRGILSDSKIKKPAIEGLNILDSTTISLFSDILKGTGRNPIDGKKKGGIKMHTMINASEDVPSLIRFTSATTHDHEFLKELELKRGSFIVFDRGYNDYEQYASWILDGIFFITRQKDNASYNSIAENIIPDDTDAGIIKDEIIEVNSGKKKIQLRRVAYWHDEQKKVYEYITNNYSLSADKIAGIYKNRWQIELLFKRLKQNFPLKYFLGDSQNAIEIQIWVSLIIQVIMLVIQRKAERRWAFSNMMSVVRYHLMSYIDLFKFLNNPESDWEKLRSVSDEQLALFRSG